MDEQMQERMMAAVIVALAPYIGQPLEDRIAAIDAAVQVLSGMADLEDQFAGKLVQAHSSGA